MSNVLREYSFRNVTPTGIEQLCDNLTDIEIRECKEITGKTPKVYLTSQLGNTSLKEIVKDDEDKTVGILGVTRIKGIICPYILIDKNLPLNIRTLLPVFRDFLDALWEEEDFAMLALKLADNTKQTRFIKLLGFEKAPNVKHKGTQGGELHEYILKRSQYNECRSSYRDSRTYYC